MANLDLSRIMVLYLSSSISALQYLEQTTPGGVFASGPTQITDAHFSKFATQTDWLGRVCAVLGMTDGQFGFVMEASTFEHAVWTQPISLGKEFSGKDIHLARNRDGRLEVFSISAAIGQAGNVIHAYQTKPMEDPASQAWSDFEDLGGTATSITIGKNGDGTLIVFALQEDGSIWFTEQEKPLPGTEWTGWTGLGGSASHIDVISKPDGTVVLFAIQKDGTIASRSQQDASKHTWQDEWVDLTSGILLGPVQNMALAQNADGSIMVVAVDKTYIWAQSLTPSGWSGWLHFHEAQPMSELSLIMNADGRLDMFAGDRGSSTIKQLCTQTFPNAPLWRPVDFELSTEATGMACVLDRTFVPGEHMDMDERQLCVG